MKDKTPQTNKKYECKVESKEEYYIALPEDLPYEVGQKFSIKCGEDGSFLLTPYVKEVFDIEDELFLSLAKLAHERDITLNDLVNEILIERIEVMEQERDFEEESSSEDFYDEETYTENFPFLDSQYPNV